MNRTKMYHRAEVFSRMALPKCTLPPSTFLVASTACAAGDLPC